MQKEKGLYIFNPQCSDLSNPLGFVQNTGVVHIPAMLDKDFRLELLRELEEGPFEKAQEEINEVPQRFEQFEKLGTIETDSYLGTLRIATVRAIHNAREFFPALSRWDANDTVVQQYGADGHLGAHRDFKHYHGVVAIYTVSGKCAFEITDGKQGVLLRAFTLGAGDLLLLRATHFNGHNTDERPFHRVSGNLEKGTRISVAFRYNTRLQGHKDPLCSDPPPKA